MKKNKVIYLMNHHPKERVRKKNWHRFIKENLVQIYITRDSYIIKGINKKALYKTVLKLCKGDTNHNV